MRADRARRMQYRRRPYESNNIIIIILFRAAGPRSQLGDFLSATLVLRKKKHERFFIVPSRCVCVLLLLFLFSSVFPGLERVQKKILSVVSHRNRPCLPFEMYGEKKKQKRNSEHSAKVYFRLLFMRVSVYVVLF